jgi:hypothetical protein
MTVTLAPWQPANNGAGKRRWFLYRDDNTPFAQRWYLNSVGDLVRYVSYPSAKRAALRFNLLEAAERAAKQDAADLDRWAGDGGYTP